MCRKSTCGHSPRGLIFWRVLVGGTHPPILVFFKKENFKKLGWGGKFFLGAISLNSWWYSHSNWYKPSQDLGSYTVKQNHIGSVVSEILRYRQTNIQAEILLLLFKDILQIILKRGFQLVYLFVNFWASIDSFKAYSFSMFIFCFFLCLNYLKSFLI